MNKFRKPIYENDYDNGFLIIVCFPPKRLTHNVLHLLTKTSCIYIIYYVAHAIE